MSDFLAYALKSIAQFIRPELEALFDQTPNEFDSFDDVLKLYEGGIKVPEGFLKDIGDNIPLEMIKEIFRTDGAQFLKFPTPQVIKGMIYINEERANGSYLYMAGTAYGSNISHYLMFSLIVMLYLI